MSKQVSDAAAKRKGQPNNSDPLEDVKLIDQVTDKLENIFGSTEDNLEVDDELEDDDDLEVEDDDHEDDEDDDEDDHEEEDDVDDDEESSTREEDEDGQDSDSHADDDLKPIPQAYLQAAKAYGWDEDKINRMLKLDREAALEALEGIYQTRNQINAHYSNMGRQAKNKHAKKQDSGLPKIDTKALRDSMGEEAAPLIDMLEKQNQAIEALLQGRQEPEQDDSHLLPDLDQRHRSAVDELSIEQQINSFFESDAMKPFGEVYGKMHLGQTMEDLPAGQRKYRWEVLKKADAIVGGAKMQGREVSLQEALIDAHLLVSQGFRDKVLVDGIRKKVVKRSKGRTLKPSKGHRKPNASERKTKDGKRTERQLLQDTQDRLNKIFR